MVIFLLFLAFIMNVPMFADTLQPRICSSSDFQACKSCSALAKATVNTGPNEGEYFHGAQWNGLYAAYVHDCKVVGENLLRRGANSNWGGSSGSMVISVANKWPHNNKAVNQRWATLLLKYRANGRETVPDQGRTPKELLKEYNGVPDYPDIWNQFQHH